MATITSTGIGSGLDVNAIVTELMAIESRPLTLLQRTESDLNTQLSAIGTLQGRMSALRDASNALTSVSLWNGTTATSSNAAAVRVSSTSGAAAGNYSVQVQALASRQNIYSQAFGSATAAVGSGSLTIELGTWTGASFAANGAKPPVSITIGEGETSLTAIRDKINGANAGVTATIVTDANGARLSLASKDTGEANGFRITATEATDDGSATTGLSTLGFTSTSGAPMTRSQTAANAQATINGIALSSASNTMEGVADGLTLTLLQTTTTAADVRVASDTEAVKKSIETFVSAFNDVANYIRDQTRFNPDTKVGGTLQGDRLATSLQSQLRAIVNESSTASGTFQRLSDVGISFTTNGTLSINGTKLGEALGNLGELRKVMAADGANSSSSGFIDRFKDFASSMLGSEGAFESRNSSLRGQLSLNNKSQESMERRLSQTEARLRRQYQALDTAMSQLNGTSSYLGQQLEMLSKTASSR